MVIKIKTIPTKPLVLLAMLPLVLGITAYMALVWPVAKLIGPALVAELQDNYGLAFNAGSIQKTSALFPAFEISDLTMQNTEGVNIASIPRLHIGIDFLALLKADVKVIISAYDAKIVASRDQFGKMNVLSYNSKPKTSEIVAKLLNQTHLQFKTFTSTIEINEANWNLKKAIAPVDFVIEKLPDDNHWQFQLLQKALTLGPIAIAGPMVIKGAFTDLFTMNPSNNSFNTSELNAEVDLSKAEISIFEHKIHLSSSTYKIQFKPQSNEDTTSYLLKENQSGLQCTITPQMFLGANSPSTSPDNRPIAGEYDLACSKPDADNNFQLKALVQREGIANFQLNFSDQTFENFELSGSMTNYQQPKFTTNIQASAATFQSWQGRNLATYVQMLKTALARHEIEAVATIELSSIKVESDQLDEINLTASLADGTLSDIQLSLNKAKSKLQLTGSLDTKPDRPLFSSTIELQNDPAADLSAMLEHLLPTNSSLIPILSMATGALTMNEKLQGRLDLSSNALEKITASGVFSFADANFKLIDISQAIKDAYSQAVVKNETQKTDNKADTIIQKSLAEPFPTLAGTYKASSDQLLTELKRGETTKNSNSLSGTIEFWLINKKLNAELKIHSGSLYSKSIPINVGCTWVAPCVRLEEIGAALISLVGGKSDEL